MSIKDVLIGSTPAQRLYRGDALLWERQTEDVRFWVTSEDAPAIINGKTYIYEKVKNLGFEQSGGASYDSANKVFNMRGGSFVNSTAVLNTYDFGHHWKLYFDIDAPTKQSNVRYFLDFGSISSSSHAFGFGLLLGNNATSVDVNWKLKGKNSNPGISSLSHDYIPKNESNYERLIGYYAIVDGGDGYDRLEVSINDIVNRYDVKIPQTSYSGTPTAWNKQIFAIGGGINNSYPLYHNWREYKMVAID